MDGSTFTKAILALLAWREERSNGISGELAVCFVVRNRVNAGWSQGDWGKVIETHGQFSSISIIGDSQTVLYPDTRDPLFLTVLQAVEGIYDGTTDDTLTNGALYYADLSSKAYNKGGWFDRNIVQFPETHPRCAVIGSTTFFK